MREGSGVFYRKGEGNRSVIRIVRRQWDYIVENRKSEKDTAKSS